jgi:hypothetical protein
MPHVQRSLHVLQFADIMLTLATFQPASLSANGSESWSLEVPVLPLHVTGNLVFHIHGWYEHCATPISQHPINNPWLGLSPYWPLYVSMDVVP